MMDRSLFISMADPILAVRTSEFLETFPEFQKYRHIAPLIPPPSSGGFMPFEPWHPSGVFEHILLYISTTGVKMSYCIEQFSYIQSHLHDRSFLTWPLLQPKKRPIYVKIYEWMDLRGIQEATLTIKQAIEMQKDIKGLGPGYVAFMKQYFTDDDDICMTTDRNFQKGFKKIYGEDATKGSFMAQKTKEYTDAGFGRIANAYVFQVFHYS